jgi:ketosteroid isomerase-like protein
MSQANVEIVQRVWTDFTELLAGLPEGMPLEQVVESPQTQRSVAKLMDRFDPEVEWDLSNFVGWPEAQHYHGHAGMLAFWRAYLSAWESMEWEIEDMLEAGEHVVVLLRQHVRGRGSGAGIDRPPYAQVWTLRDGRVVRFAAYTDRSAALLTAGLGTGRAARRTA